VPYLTPDSVPEGRVCRALFIPDDTAWLALVSGILTEGAKYWNWEQFGTLTPQECVDVMNEIIQAYYDSENCGCGLPEGGAIIRLNQSYVVQELTGGEWTTPSSTYAIPPPPERTEPTSEQRICLAAKNAVNILQQTYEEITDSFTTGLTVIEALAAVGAFLIGAVVAPLGAVVIGLAALAIASWKVGYDIVEFVTSDFWDAQFTENLTCALIRCATDVDGIVTFDFECVNNELINQIEWLDPTISSYTLAGQVRWLLAQFGADGLNAAGGTTEIIDDDCSFCDVVHCYEIDFRDSDHSGVFTLSAGSYSAGVGYIGEFGGSESQSDVTGYWTFPETVHLQSYQVQFSKSTGGGANNSARAAVLVNPISNWANDRIELNTGAPPTIGTHLCLSNTIDADADGLGADVNSGNVDGTSTLELMRVSYIGDIPSGWSDNCTEDECT